MIPIGFYSGCKLLYCPQGQVRTQIQVEKTKISDLWFVSVQYKDFKATHPEVGLRGVSCYMNLPTQGGF